MMNNINIMLCNLADSVAVSGASIFVWGEKELSESLKEKYERLHEDERDEEV